jgi:acetyl esterase
VALDPQAQVIVDLLAAQEGPRLHELTPAEARRVYEQFAGGRTSDDPLASVEDRTVAVEGGEVGVRVYTPEGEGPFGACVYLHGGGWVIGTVASHDALCRSLASRSGCVFVSVEYRLSPEHPFPTPLEDAYAATAWVAAGAGELDVDPARLAVGGDSAGGNMAAAVTLLARDRGGPALAFQLLLYPVTDHSFGQPSYTDNADGYLLTADTMRWFSACYLPDRSLATDPRAAPLHAPDLSGLPPALIVTAEYDPLRDEGEAYGARLADAGVAVDVRRYDGMIHGFVSMPELLDQGAEALDHCARTLREALGG